MNLNNNGVSRYPEHRIGIIENRNCTNLGISDDSIGVDIGTAFFRTARVNPTTGQSYICLGESGCLISGGDDKAVKVWDVASGWLFRNFLGHDGKVNCLDVSPNGCVVASGGDDNQVVLWSLVRLHTLIFG